MRSGLRVCIFCSASELDEKYVKPARELARLLATHQHTLIYGGSDKGLMKVMAEGAQAGGAKVVGVSVEYLRNVARKELDELIIAKTLGERKAAMLEKSDIIIMMVGGIGTLDELTEVIELKKHGQHNKPIIILNTDNFYKGLKLQLERMEKDGFFLHPLSKYVQFVDTPKKVISLINAIR